MILQNQMKNISQEVIERIWLIMIWSGRKLSKAETEGTWKKKLNAAIQSD